MRPPPFPALGRLAPLAQPAAQAWSIFAVSQVAEALPVAEPGEGLPPDLLWAMAHMLLAGLICSLLWISTANDEGSPTMASRLRRSRWARLCLIGFLAGLIALLLGLLVIRQPLILLPVAGLAMTYPGWAASLRQQEVSR